MESFRAYLKQTKIFFIACVFMAAVSTAVICLYQLPLEAAVYLAVLWLGAGAAVFLYGYACYRQKVQNLILVEKAPEINLDRLGETTDEVELLYRDIIRKLDGMRMGAETERQRSLEEMTRLLHYVGTSDQDADLCSTPAASGGAGGEPGVRGTAFSH